MIINDALYHLRHSRKEVRRIIQIWTNGIEGKYSHSLEQIIPNLSILRLKKIYIISLAFSKKKKKYSDAYLSLIFQRI